MNSTDRSRCASAPPTDLLALIPFLLGFHPTASLVLLALAADGTLPPSHGWTWPPPTDRLGHCDRRRAITATPAPSRRRARARRVRPRRPGRRGDGHHHPGAACAGIAIGEALRGRRGPVLQLAATRAPGRPTDPVDPAPARSPPSPGTRDGARPDRRRPRGHPRTRSPARPRRPCGPPHRSLRLLADLMDRAAPRTAPTRDGPGHPAGWRWQHTRGSTCARPPTATAGEPGTTRKPACGRRAATASLRAVRGLPAPREAWQIAM